MLKKIVSTVFACGLYFAAAAAPQIIGYYPYWAQYSQFYPKDVRFNLLTSVHYVGFVSDPAGAVAFADESDAANFESLVTMAKNNRVAIVASVGGADNADNLKAAAESDASRSALVSNILQLVKKHGLSGIELDWMPTPESKGAYASLVKSISEAFGKESPRPTLAVTLPWDESKAEAFDQDAISAVDYATLQAIDYMDESKSTVTANAGTPLTKKAIELWTGKGFDVSKLIIVVPFYGKSFIGATGLGESQTGVGSGNEGLLTYKELLEKFEGDVYKVSFDEATQSEVAVSKDEVIVFNGIPSVKSLATLAKDQGALGVAVYDLTNDHPQPIVSLLVTVGKVLRPEINYKSKKK